MKIFLWQNPKSNEDHISNNSRRMKKVTNGQGDVAGKEEGAIWYVKGIRKERNKEELTS